MSDSLGRGVEAISGTCVKADSHNARSEGKPPAALWLIHFNHNCLKSLGFHERSATDRLGEEVDAGELDARHLVGPCGATAA